MKTLYVCRPVMNAQSIIDWAKKEKIINITKLEDMHVTVAYSNKKVEWNNLIKIKDKISIFTKENRSIELFDSNALVLKFKSNALKERWKYFKENGCSWDYPEYNPHITLSYVKQIVNIKDIRPYIGEIVLGNEVWREVDNDWELSK